MADLKLLKEKLEKELSLLEVELSSIGRKNPNNQADWEAVPAKMDVSASDENAVADTIEEYEGNTAVLKQLEIRYNEVRCALERMEKGTYGVCSVGGEQIEEDRLMANPAATTCKKHI